MSRPRATLISHAPGLTIASVSALIIRSVSGVSGAARTMKSDSASSSGQRLRAADAVEHDLAERPRLVLGVARRRPGIAAPPDRDDPAAERGRERPDRPADRAEPDDADGHVAQLGALERLPRPLALQLEELREPPADREDHHQDVLGDRPAEHAARVGDDDPALEGGRGQRPLHAGRRRVDPRQPRRAGQDPVERVRAEPAAEHDLDVVERPVGEPLDRHRDDGRAGRGGADPLEVARAIAGGQDRAERDRASGAPPGPEPGPARPRPPSLMPAAVEDAGDPALGGLDLAVARQRLGAGPERRRARPARAARRSPGRTARPSCTARS